MSKDQGRHFGARHWLLGAGFLLIFSVPSLSQKPRAAKSPPPQTKSADKTKAAPGTAQPAPPRSRNSGENARKREAWFYEQRAYPRKDIPAGALARAMARLEEMRRAERERAAARDVEAIMASEMMWTPIGPQPTSSRSFGFTSGRISALAADPTNPDIAYTGGAFGGVWKTTDGGVNWTPLTDGEVTLAVGAIAIDASSCTPGPCKTIYVGTGEQTFSSASYYGAGILKSTDGGATWTHLPGNITNVPGITSFQGPISAGFSPGGGARISSLAVNAQNPNVILAGVQFFVSAGSDGGASSGIFRSTDGGVNWNLVKGGAAGTEVFFDPNNPQVAWAALGTTFGDADNGLYRSVDMGFSWGLVTGGGLPSSNLGRIEVAIAPTNSNVLYVSIANSSQGSQSLLGLFRTGDGGTMWTNTNAPDFCAPQCWYDHVIRVHPNDANTVYAGGSAANFGTGGYFVRSTNGGGTWEGIGSTNLRIHVDVHAVAFGVGPGVVRLYNGNDGGVYTTDVTNPTGSIVWTHRNSTLNVTQFYPGASMHPASENRGIGGTQDNGTQRYDNSLEWEEVTCGDGGWTAIDPFVPSTVYATCQFIDVRKSLLNGNRNTFVFADAGLFESGDDVAFIPPFIHDPSVPERLYFGTFRVWQTMDGAITWQPISPDLDPIDVIRTLSVAASDSNFVYAGTGTGRIWRTANAGAGAGATWTEMTDTNVLPNRRVTMLATHPLDPNTVFATFSGFDSCPAFMSIPACDGKGHVFRFAAGAWVDITGVGAGRLPDTPVNDIVVDPNDLTGNTLYIATDVGVFWTMNGGLSWTTLSVGLPRVAVTSLKLRQAARILRAGTHGRGMWDLQLPGLPEFHLRSLTRFTMNIGAFSSFGLKGGGFTPDSRVHWDGQQLATTFFSENELGAEIPFALADTPKVAMITVVDPVKGVTNALPFTVTGGAPAVNNVSPTAVPQGSGDTTITVMGTTFFSNSVVRFDGAGLATTFVSSSQLQATVPASLLTTGGVFLIRVLNPPPGGGESSSAALFTVTAPPPPNDNFASAITVNPTNGMFTDTQNSVGATVEASDPIPPCTPVGFGRNRSMWYRFTPSQTMTLAVDTFGSAYDTVLSAWTGTSPSALFNVGCNDDAVTLAGPSRITLTAQAGNTYHFMITGWNDSEAGVTQFNVKVLVPPPNDNLSSALPVTTVPFTHTVDTSVATVESSDPAPTCTSGAVENGRARSVWYRYVPSSSGTVQADTFGSSYDTILAVFTGSPGAFIQVACDDDAGGSGGSSALSFSATAGTAYHIMVSAWSGAAGDLVFNVTSGPPPGPDYSVGASPSSLTVTRGQSGNATITVTPFTGFSAQVTFACSGLPSLSNCAFSPASVTPSGSAVNTTLTISTTAPSAASPAASGAPPPQAAPWAVWLALVLLLLALLVAQRHTRRLRWAGGVALGVVLLLAVLQVACGGGGGGGGPSPPSPPSNPGTPQGTFIVTVTATSGTQTRTVPVTLMVQ